MTMTGIEIYHLAGGKVVGYWGEANMSGLFAAAPDREAGSVAV